MAVYFAPQDLRHQHSFQRPWWYDRSPRQVRCADEGRIRVAVSSGLRPQEGSRASTIPKVARNLNGANGAHNMADNKGELAAIGAVVGNLFVMDYPVPIPKVIRGG